MKDHLFARLFRASGRLALFTGFIISFGLILTHAYFYFQSLFNINKGTTTITIVNSPITISNEGLPPDKIFAGIACIAVLIVIFVLIAKVYNNHMRSIIVRLSHLFKAKIFTVEVVSTLIVWTVATLFFLITYPIISVATLFALIVNELLFVLAWGAYGQPDYKK